MFKQWFIVKGQYCEKQVFSGLYIYKLVLPEPANTQNEENKPSAAHPLVTWSFYRLFRFSSYLC